MKAENIQRQNLKELKKEKLSSLKRLVTKTSLKTGSARKSTNPAKLAHFRNLENVTGKENSTGIDSRHSDSMSSDDCGQIAAVEETTSRDGFTVTPMEVQTSSGCSEDQPVADGNSSDHASSDVTKKTAKEGNGEKIDKVWENIRKDLGLKEGSEQAEEDTQPLPDNSADREDGLEESSEGSLDHEDHEELRVPEEEEPSDWEERDEGTDEGSRPNSASQITNSENDKLLLLISSDEEGDDKQTQSENHQLEEDSSQTGDINHQRLSNQEHSHHSEVNGEKADSDSDHGETEDHTSKLQLKSASGCGEPSRLEALLTAAKPKCNSETLEDDNNRTCSRSSPILATADCNHKPDGGSSRSSPEPCAEDKEEETVDTCCENAQNGDCEATSPVSLKRPSSPKDDDDDDRRSESDQWGVKKAKLDAVESLSPAVVALSDSEDKVDAAENVSSPPATVESQEDKSNASDVVVDSDEPPPDSPTENKVHLTKSTLKNILSCTLNECLGETSNKNQLHILRKRCEYLEGLLDKWRRKSYNLQKQITDMLLQQQPKGINKQVQTRSVGVYVQMPTPPTSTQSFITSGHKFAATRDGMLSSSNPGNPRVSTATTTTPSAVAINQPPRGNMKKFPASGSISIPATFAAMTPVLIPVTNSAVQLTQSLPVRNATSNVDRPATGNPSSVPVPMQLIANTATGPQLAPRSQVAAPANAAPLPTCFVRAPLPTTSTVSLIAASSSTPALPSVKVIDLTREEDDASSAQSTGVSTSLSTVSAVAGSGGLVTVSSALPRIISAPTVSIPTSPVGTMQSPRQPIQSMVHVIPAPVGGTIRVGRPPIPIVPQPPQGARFTTYLVPSAPTTLAVMPRSEGSRPMAPNAVAVPAGIVTNAKPSPTILVRMNTPPRFGISASPFQMQTAVATSIRQPTNIVPSVASVRPPAAAASASPRAPLQTVVVSQVASSVSPVINVATVTTKTTQPEPKQAQPLNVTSNSNSGTMVISCTAKHPASLPVQPTYPETPGLKTLPPRPALKISKVTSGIVLSWNMTLNSSHAQIATYQLYAYQENNGPPNISLWKKVGDVKALPLPMACTLTQFVEGHKYHFAVRAVDIHNRLGPFSDPSSIVLTASGAPTPK